MPRTRFTSDPPQVLGQSDLDHANTLLEQKAGTSPAESAEHHETAAAGDRIASDKSTNGNITGDSTDDSTPINSAQLEKLGTYDRYEITEDDCYEELGFSFPTWKKWYILTVIFWVQVSMNFNASLYSNALVGISDEFGVSLQGARCGAMIFLVLYAFGWFVTPLQFLSLSSPFFPAVSRSLRNGIWAMSQMESFGCDR